MDFLTAVKTCFWKYFVFSGRARRSEYWWFFLFNILMGIILSFIDGLLFGTRVPFTSSGFSTGDGPISGLYNLVVFIPSLAVTWRRLHDTGRSGWWIGGMFLYFLGLFVIVATLAESSTGAFLGLLMILSVLALLIYIIVLLIFLCQDSQKRDNRYGPSPKYGSEVDVFD